jgi:phenylacetate-CoA ligase
VGKPRQLVTQLAEMTEMTYQWLARNALLPVLDICRSRKVAEYWKILERNQWLKPESLVDFQQKRMRALLKHAYENVPYYHNIFNALGLHPSEISKLEDLKKLPILKKAPISSSANELTARNLSKREIVPRYTSGTTAAPLRFYTTNEGISWGTAAWLRAYSWGGYKLGDKHSVIRAFSASELKNPSLRIINLLLRRNVLLNAYGVSTTSIQASARKMQTLRPQFLMGYSWGIHMLADYFMTEGIRPPQLQAIFTSAETTLPSRRIVIEKTFGCEVYDVYGSREFSTIASECERHSGYHIQSENVLLEFIKDGESVGPGETGAILVTDLHNYAMPFIRYEIGDVGKICEDPCPCGRCLPLFESLEGRNYEFFVTSDGSILYLRDLDTVFEELPVKMFQIIQRTLDDILINVVAADGYSEKDAEFIKRNIAWNPRKTTNIEVRKVESIVSERSGKKPYLINRLSNRFPMQES